MSEAARNSKAPESAETNLRQFELRRNPDGTTTTFRSAANSNFFEPVPGKTYQAGQTVSFLTNREPDSETVKRKPIKSRDDKGQLLNAPETLNNQSVANTRTEILPGSNRSLKRPKRSRFTQKTFLASLLFLFLLFFGLLAGQIYFAKQLEQSRNMLNQRITALEQSLQDNYRELNGTKLDFEQQLSQLKQEQEAEKKRATDKPKENSTNLKTALKRSVSSKKKSLKRALKSQDKSKLTVGSSASVSKAKLAKASEKTRATEARFVKAGDEVQAPKKKAFDQAEESFERALNSLKDNNYQANSSEASIVQVVDKSNKKLKSPNTSKRCFKQKSDECEAKF